MYFMLGFSNVVNQPFLDGFILAIKMISHWGWIHRFFAVQVGVQRQRHRCQNGFVLWTFPG
jgi:hypothetical protein